MSRFSGLSQSISPKCEPHPTTDAVASPALKSKARDGKTFVGGYFSPELRRALHQIALDEDMTIQALLGEAIDALLRSRGKSPFGER